MKMDVWVLRVDDCENNDVSVTLYENESDATFDAICLEECLLDEYVNSEGENLSEIFSTQYKSFKDYVFHNDYDKALLAYDEFMSNTYGAEVFISVYKESPIKQATNKKLHRTAIIQQSAKRQEKSCICCGKMNDVGVNECWNCTNNPG
jgi:beta-galactosidase GanA